MISMPRKLYVCSPFCLSCIILFETVRSNALVKLAISTELAMAVAKEAARASGEILLKYFREDAYRTKYKEDTSLQTTADLESEQVIIDTIKSNFPEHSIDSEERGYFCTSSPYKWLIDALDGTENFVLGIPYFSSSITLCDENVPQIAVVFNPVTEDLYTAERGKGAFLNGTRINVSNEVQLKGSRAFFIPDFATKRIQKTACLRNKLYGQCRRVLDMWSPALDWCLVANGKVDSVVNISNRPIQPDAGILILEEAGGKITDFENRVFNDDNNGLIVGSNSLLHEQLLQLINED
jgi:myo-inositol-1(or 4)-monophosphatase